MIDIPVCISIEITLFGGVVLSVVQHLEIAILEMDVVLVLVTRVLVLSLLSENSQETEIFLFI